MLNALFFSLHSYFEETMRASVVLLFALLALTFVAVYVAVEVSDNIRGGGRIRYQSPNSYSIAY